MKRQASGLTGVSGTGTGNLRGATAGLEPRVHIPVKLGKHRRRTRVMQHTGRPDCRPGTIYGTMML